MLPPSAAPGADAVPDRGRSGERLPRLAAARIGPPRRGRAAAGRGDRGDPRRKPADLRQPKSACPAASPRDAGQPQAGRAAEAGGRPRRSGSLPPGAACDRQRASPSGRPEPAGPALCGRPAGRGPARGYQPHLDRQGLALPGRSAAPCCPRDRRLEHGRPSPGRPHLRCAAHGHPPPAAPQRVDPSLEAQDAARQLALPGHAGTARNDPA